MLDIVFHFLLALLCLMGMRTNKTAGGSSRYDFCSLVSVWAFTLQCFCSLPCLWWHGHSHLKPKMFIDCTFGKINTPEGQKMTANFIANLAAFKHFRHSCFVKTDGQNHQHNFLQVRAKRNQKSRGEHIFLSAFSLFKKILLNARQSRSSAVLKPLNSKHSAESMRFGWRNYIRNDNRV